MICRALDTVKNSSGQQIDGAESGAALCPFCLVLRDWLAFALLVLHGFARAQERRPG